MTRFVVARVGPQLLGSRAGSLSTERSEVGKRLRHLGGESKRGLPVAVLVSWVVSRKSLTRLIARCLPDPAAFQSLCAVQQQRKGQALRAAASLLHAAAYGLRASLAGNQQAGGVTDFTYSALIPNLDAQDGIRRAGVDSFPVHVGLEDARRVRPPVWG